MRLAGHVVATLKMTLKMMRCQSRLPSATCPAYPRAATLICGGVPSATAAKTAMPAAAPYAL